MRKGGKPRMRQGFCFWGRSNSGEIARSRLKLLLVSDQAGLSLGLLDQIREDMEDVLSRYAEIDGIMPWDKDAPDKRVWQDSYTDGLQWYLEYVYGI